MKKALYVGGGVIVGIVAYKNKGMIVNGVKNVVSKIGGNKAEVVTEAPTVAAEQQPQVQSGNNGGGNKPYYNYNKK